MLSLGALRLLRSSCFALTQPDACGAGESGGVLESWSVRSEKGGVAPALDCGGHDLNNAFQMACKQALMTSMIILNFSIMSPIENLPIYRLFDLPIGDFGF